MSNPGQKLLSQSGLKLLLIEKDEVIDDPGGSTRVNKFSWFTLLIDCVHIQPLWRVHTCESTSIWFIGANGANKAAAVSGGIIRACVNDSFIITAGVLPVWGQRCNRNH